MCYKNIASSGQMDNWILSEGKAHMTDGNIIQSIARCGIQADGMYMLLINLGKRDGGVLKEKDCKCNYCTTMAAL